jgi:hypothetical protein
MKVLMRGEVELSTDGCTVWAQGPTGPLGRFSDKLSEVHTPRGSTDFGTWTWDQFRTTFEAKHGVVIPEDFRNAEPVYEGEWGPILTVSIEKLRQHHDPIERPPSTWQFILDGPEERAAHVESFKRTILGCLKDKQFIKEPFRAVLSLATKNWDMEQHASRIAYLMDRDWKYPIEIDFDGLSPLVCEGNHRLAAAIMRGDVTIEAVFIGELDIHRVIAKGKKTGILFRETG